MGRLSGAMTASSLESRYAPLPPKRNKAGECRDTWDTTRPQ
eukprot:COSAG03_NODE_10513_length_646_cov_0.665448_1_plen_40_part_10